MRQCIGLLAGQDKAARFRTRQRRFAFSVTDLMPFLLGYEFGGAVQALFGLDHLAGGEAVLATFVRAEFEQLGRVPHAPMTALNCSIPSLCRCANTAMSRRVNVDCW